jgi:hypothetical protein
VQVAIHWRQNIYHHVESSQVSRTEHYRVCNLTFHSVPLGEIPPPAQMDCIGRDELVAQAGTEAIESKDTRECERHHCEDGFHYESQITCPFHCMSTKLNSKQNGMLYSMREYEE